MKDINNILANHFSGEATPEENLFVKDWKANNQAEYAILEKAYNTKINLEHTTTAFNETLAWEKVKSRFKPKAKKAVIPIKTWRKLSAIAAIAILGLLTFLFINKSQVNQFVNYDSNPFELILPDGSTVWLAKGAEVAYSKNFETHREINLKGEAYFEVERDENHPFKIETNAGSIEVLGTGFNINAEENSTVVNVSHGRVAFSTKKDKIELSSGEGAISKQDKIKPIQEDQRNIFSWVTGQFIFEDTPLKDVVSILNKYYPEKIELLSPEKGDYTLSGNFNQVEIKDIIEVIELTCDVEATTNDGVIKLK